MCGVFFLLPQFVCIMCICSFLGMNTRRYMWRQGVNNEMSSITLFMCLRQGFSLSLELMDSVRLVAKELQGPSCVYLSSTGIGPV